MRQVRPLPLFQQVDMMTLTAQSFQGIWPAFPTPTTPGGAVDIPALHRLIDHLIAEGASGLVPVGGTGEFTALSPEARTTVVAETVKAARGRVPVAAGILSPGY